MTEDIREPTQPAMLQHQLVKLRRMYREIMRDYDDITISQSVSRVADRRWEHNVTFVIEPDQDDIDDGDDEILTFVMIVPYMRYGHRWHQGKIQTVLNGERDEETEDEIGDVIVRMLSDRGRVNAGDRTTPLSGDTRGSRSNGVEVRNVTVIRN